jgi:DNA-binding CsgD family transcriptional regulator
MKLQTELSSLIADIYDGVSDPALWRKAVGQLVKLSGARFAYYAVIDSAAQTIPASGVIGEESSRLDDALALHRDMLPIDPGLPYALARPQGGVFCFSETGKALTEDPQAWRDFIRHELGSGDYHSRFGAEHAGVSLVLALHTAPDQPVLTPEQAQLHATVFDQLQRAMRLAYRMPEIGQAREALMLVDAKGQIRNASALAESLLSANDGLTVAQGRLRAADPAQDRTLQSHIHEICEGGGMQAERYCVVSSASRSQGFLLRLGPVPLPSLGMEGAAYRCLVEILGARDHEAVQPDDLRSLFGLTQREAEIAALFASTFNDLRSVARQLGISHETARVHVRSVFSKVGVSNQVELVRALARLR